MNALRGKTTGTTPTVLQQVQRRINELAKQLESMNSSLEVGLRQSEASNDPAARTVDAQVRAMHAPKRWLPSESDLVRGRQALLEEFNQPSNLPIARFAELAGKSRQQVYKDVAMSRLLALSSGTRGQRLPEWQLEERPRRLAQEVLAAASDIDAWTIYRSLTTLCDALAGKSPVEAARKPRSDIRAIADMVCESLGLQLERR